MRSRDIHGAMNAALGTAMAVIGGYYYSDLPDAAVAVLVTGSFLLVGREVWMMGDNLIWRAVRRGKAPEKVHVGPNSNIDLALKMANLNFKKDSWIPRFTVDVSSLSPEDRSNIRFLCDKHGVDEVAFRSVVMPVSNL